MSYDTNVFINCPFDDDYKPILKTMIFTLKKLGFTPRLALERFDSAEVRLAKIKELIDDSKYGIHDISRHKSSKKKEYYRLNMPFELGLDISCRNYNPDLKYRQKRILILEEEKYSVQKALSDMAFADCACHKADAEIMINEIRNWFASNDINNLPSPSSIWYDYNDFCTYLYEKKKEENFSDKEINNIPIKELMNYMDKKIALVDA